MRDHVAIQEVVRDLNVAFVIGLLNLCHKGVTPGQISSIIGVSEGDLRRLMDLGPRAAAQGLGRVRVSICAPVPDFVGVIERATECGDRPDIHASLASLALVRRGKSPSIGDTRDAVAQHA